MTKIKSNAFTLIELSIVLVIIGLIVGGVLVGQDLIKAAQLRAIVSDAEKIATAHNTFRLKYNCLPGDCRNAATFGLGSNGDGDKLLTTSVEHALYWGHLSSANIVEGSYNGVDETYTTALDLEMAVAARQTTGFSGWNLHIANITHDTTNFVLALAFTPQEAYQIDSKIDDGTPAGKIQHNTSTGLFLLGFNGNSTRGSPGCVWFAPSPEPNEYNVQYTEKACNLYLASWLD